MPKTIAFVFQEHALFAWNTILDNPVIALGFQNVGRKEAEERSREALRNVGLRGFESHYPSQLSGGMRQRAALARALSLQIDITGHRTMNGRSQKLAPTWGSRAFQISFVLAIAVA